jgi:hypothetical protein
MIQRFLPRSTAEDVLTKKHSRRRTYCKTAGEKAPNRTVATCNTRTKAEPALLKRKPAHK